MEYTDLMERLNGLIEDGELVTATISQPRQKSSDLRRVKLKPVLLKDEYHIQFEYQFERVMKHKNLRTEEAIAELGQLLENFRQGQFQLKATELHFQLSKKFKVTYKERPTDVKQVKLTHNREKQYVLPVDEPVPFLIRLGVQSVDGKVKRQKYDKFKQINRFLEFIEDSIKYLPTDRTVRILDFGSGKSYLTFALYHFLHEMKGYDVHITGLDLKKEVIEECAGIARDLGYERLEFLVGDINEFEGESAVDMVVTLHACDVATDMALARAVRWGAKVILSVPCCQKELNRQLEAPSLDVMLQHGLVKERFAALATDSIRAELLGLVGYEAQLLEFIDMEHTPKNILIRAYLTNREATEEQRVRYKAFKSLLGADPFLEGQLSDRLVLTDPQDVK
ncbi:MULTISPECIES: SAM-dependent methyltransferase [unclassified Exiguobacterium]|uniref:class I SAM-dependent methyltransferase n=1 Tax=unclassified Exiguobacterium TaxID=2644629 RepID=UPI00103D92EA|nr:MULTISPECIES: SAM-dependent methyltransferase [unclassified Exiguobacterium]TCI39661.1 SAM-dependent methyltransferase [Exiguobacterium sp. SH4S7]TCI61379.1 SAM-dependent methyltransferase [Exiguobacterium sp. SH0S2]